MDELNAWKAVAATNTDLVAKTLYQWKQDTDLVGIRDEKELAKHAEVERKEWQALRADVDAVLAKLKEGREVEPIAPLPGHTR